MKMKLKSNENGQATIEAVLFITIFLAISLSISQAFTNNNYFASLIEGPWNFVDGMIRDGVWMQAGPNSQAFNPNARTRHATRKGISPDHKPNPGFDQKESTLQL